MTPAIAERKTEYAERYSVNLLEDATRVHCEDI
jgi:hypothetical protein